MQDSYNMSFSGSLTASDGSPLPDRAIFIEDDTTYTRPNIILAITTTDSQGKFLAHWQALPKDNGSPFHFYALFLGGKSYGYTRSETYEAVLDQSNHTASGMIPPKVMPSWFRDASRLWYENKIKDPDYLHGITNLMDYSVIKSSGLHSLTHLPNWLKNNADWLSEDKISDNEYENCLEYLIDNNLVQSGL
ncbi:MAG TPA: hypothetical protein VJ792_08030 [Candidatus Nitrosotalea sp.]|nr:hypothetical protein [Candidatus Nitrosotalea sp.]